MIDDETIKHVHCMGIGGIGVSGLAELLLKKGYAVSGSDIALNANINRLKKMGAEIHLQHKTDNINQADAVIYSSAIANNNPEFLAARQKGIPLWQRGEMLAKLMSAYNSIAVAGTHGKTSTTGIVAYTLLMAGCDPSYMIGGILKDRESPAYLGSGDCFVAEADESDASFLYMHPNIAVITNIDADHLETYQGDFAQLKKSFQQFIQQIPAGGVLIACIDDPVVRDIIQSEHLCRVITYGFSEDADFRITHFAGHGLKTEFQVRRPHPAGTLTATFNMPGKHNVLNAVAMTVIANLLAIDDESLCRALITFPGMGRRFHERGRMQLAQGEALIFEDYGHHPNEIKATLAAARLAWPDRRIVMVFQPHRYSRTRDLMLEFVDVLSRVDLVILLDIYSAGEKPIAGVSGEKLYQLLLSQQSSSVVFVKDNNMLPAILREKVKAGDVIMLQGAGNVGSFATQLLADK